MDNCKLILGDCLEKMKEMPDKSVDLIVFDPPYSRYSGSDGNAVNLGHYKILEIYFKELSFEFKRLIKKTGAVFAFCDFRTYPCLYYGMFYNFKPANLIVWQKDFIGPGIHFRPLHELIVYWRCEKSKSPYNRNISDIWKAKRPKNNFHPHEKPIELIHIMIENCTKPNALVLDPFMGSGTTGVACMLLNRKFIGIEISPNYLEVAKKRIGEWQNQSRLSLFREKAEGEK